ncbi:trehalose operon repressor TreR [Vibrio gazogenes]|uniref:Trehalose operon repressor n=1 Tax=Vibrio gazogenes TaxID=687 RepID=A0A1Z2SHH2_VIBGA|nr:trehalose operon repressor TreR [Vibrio gazogenes]ASA56612.1 trehalose operon repressor [Vibrio gazogenes]
MNHKKLTILDVARLAGVGKSTVSRVLTQDERVSPETRAKVLKVIENSGYSPSKSAQSMRGGSQKVVGIIISRLESSSESRVVSQILSVLYQRGFDVVIMESQFSHEKTAEHLSVLAKRHVDGVIVFGFSGLDLSVLQAWQYKSVVFAMESEQISTINYDNRQMILSCLDYLSRQSLSDIAFIGVDPADKTTGQQRLDAYCQWCKQSGMAPNYQTGQLSFDSAYTLVDRVMQESLQAIVCASDSIAMGVMKRLQELSREDIVVTSVGRSELLSFLFPNIYSVDPGYEAAGQQAAELLIEHIEGQKTIRHLVLSPHPTK